MGAPNDRRKQIREIVRYLRALRGVVQRGAAEHARWVHFVAEASTLLRAIPPPTRAPNAEIAAQYAALFGRYRAFLNQLKPPRYCQPLHASALAWLEALDLLSSAVAAAIHRRASGELEALVREAHEAQIRLGTFQRVHAKTMQGLKQLFQTRPRIQKPRPAPSTSPSRPRGPVAAR